MATASNPTPLPPYHSPYPSPAVDTAGGVAASIISNSPMSRHSFTPRGAASSPWTRIVRGAEPEFNGSSSSSSNTAVSTIVISPGAVSTPLSRPVSYTDVPGKTTEPSDKAAASDAGDILPSNEDAAVVDAQTETSENGGGCNAGKKPVWNKPSNGVAVVSPVMGALSWPALSESISESTKASPKSSSSESLKKQSDASTTVPQGTGNAFSTVHSGGNTRNANLSSTPNHVGHNRQRSMRRGGGTFSGSSVSANGVFSQAPPPQGLVVKEALSKDGNSGKSFVDSSSRESTHREGGQRGGYWSQSHGGNEYQQQQSSFRRGNGGPNPRGDGYHHHNYGGRRDQHRGNQDWNPHRNFGGRNAHTQHQRGVFSRPFMQGPPPATTPYIHPPSVSVRPPYAMPVVYPVYYFQGSHPDQFRAMPMVGPIGPVFVPPGDPHLHMKIVSQIDYYFSSENLVKDTYLRQNMDEQGWVSIKLIAGFKKVTQLTDDIQLILTALRSSSFVEIEDEKVRRRDDWKKWIIPPSVQYSYESSPQSFQKSSHDMLEEQLQSVSLDEKKTWDVHSEGNPSRSSSVEVSSMSHSPGNEMTGQVAIQSVHPTMATTNETEMKKCSSLT